MGYIYSISKQGSVDICHLPQSNLSLSNFKLKLNLLGKFGILGPNYSERLISENETNLCLNCNRICFKSCKIKKF